MTNFGDMVIYDIHGSKLMDAILTEGAGLERELGKTDVVKLSWNSDCKKTLPVGSYIVPFSDGLKYRLLDDYTPSEDSTSVKYEPVFNHPLAVLSRIPFLYDTTDQDGNPIKQQEWPYDGLTTNALEYACKAINEALGITDESKKFTYTLCGTVDPTISFSVSSNDILSVLSSMAQACKGNSSEWHLSWEDHTLYFGQIFINFGEKVPLLKVHDNINFASVNSSNEPYYNCFYPQGSSRNMSRKAQVGLGNVATLVRLGLNKNKFPDGCIYVDKDSNVITKQEFVQSGAVKQMVALSFDDVYPHIDLYAYNVRPRYRYLKNRQTNEIEKDANGKNKVYTTWYMRLAYPTTVKDDTKTLVNTTNDIDEHGKQVTHYWYDYELNKKEQVLQGHTLKGTFKVNTHATNGKYDALTQSLVGQPNGQDGFEFAYFDKNDAKEIPSNQNDGDSGINIKAGDYQIMFYQSGDIIIPTNQEEGLYPRGNNLPDFTCNIVVLFNIKQGQQEITSAQEELAKRTIKEIERRFKDNNNYTFSSNPVAFEEKNPNLHIGQKVIFNDGQGYELSTRVIKIESKIDFPFIQNVTVGNQAVKGAITQLKEDVKSILSGNFSGGGGLNASQLENVIKNFTLPRFLRKDVADEAKGHITFWQGLTALVKSFFNGVENNGDIRNKGDIINDGNITTKNLTVTDKATFFELEIQKAKAAGGMSVNSAGTFHIDAVEETKTKDGFVCYQRAEKDGVKLLQTCEVSDQMMCSNGMNILKGGKGNHFYWRKVTEAPKGVVMHTIDCKEEKCLKIVLSKTDHSENTVDIPKVGDDLVQMGNPDNKERQSVIMTCAYKGLDGDLKAPYWVQYDGVNDYKLSTHKRTWFAANGSQVTGNFKVQSDNGELESIEDYMKGLTTNTVVWHVAFSIRNITGKQGETFRLKYGRTEGENTSWYDDNPTHQGFNLLYAVIIDDATGNQQQAVLGEDLKVAKFFTGGSMTVHLKNSKTGETLAQDTIYPEAKQGKDGLDSVVFRLIPNIEKAVVKGTNRETAKVVLFLKYMITRQEGEKYYVELGRLDSFGLSLSIEPSWASFEVKWEDGKPYWVIKTTDAYANRFDDTPFFRVCLMQGGKVLDARTIGLQYEVESSFNVGKRVDGLDGKIDGISGTVKTLDGRVSGFETTIDHFSTEVKDKVSRTELKQTADGIEMKVSSSVNANLLWGSDLDLSGVQDKIQLAYNNGDVIQQNTAKKEELQRQLDATSTNDTAKRNDLQKQINDCNDEINTARNKVNECKAAIEKHLGVGLNATRVDSIEWFEYLKGGGVGGADAIKAKVAAVNGEGNYYAGLYWQTGFGAKQNIKVKPNTKYTFSFWIRTEILQGSGYAVAESINMESLTGGRRGRTMPWTKVPAKNKWERMSYTFTTGDTGYIMVGVGLSGEDDFSGLIYLCHLKLEEGDTATPWCAYDGTEEALLASGWNIKEKEFTATFDNFKVQNNRGEKTFFVDKNGIISGLRVAQPFDVYNSKEEWRNGKSYSWYIKGPIDSEDSIFSGSYLDGACVNIYNGTTKEVRMTINICFKINDYTGARSALAKLVLKPAQLFRAIGVRQQTNKKEDGDYITFYPLVPFTLERTNQAYEIAKYLLRVRDVFENVMEVGETYGGIVEKLKVSGIYKNIERLTPGMGYTMKSTDTTIVADTSSYGDANITLPRNPQVGMEVEIINIGTGLCNLETADDTKIFWNETKTKETVREHTKISLLYVGGSDNLWIYTTEGVCGNKQ